MTLFEKRDKIIKEIIKPPFKASGFGISGTTFKKQEKDFLKIFNVQSSGFNLDDSVSFYLNLGLLFPIWFEIRNEIIARSIKEYDCQFRIRTDSLTGRNQIYELTPETNFEEFEILIRNDIEKHILPFFDKYSNLDDCKNLHKDFPSSWTGCRPLIALTMIKNGEVKKGDELLNEFLSTASENWKFELTNFRNKLQ
jgi:hypothetical protein